MQSISAADDRPKPSLPLEIHAATRNHHTALNRLITSRLPLCLPPHAANPGLYTWGMTVFGQIYIAFEAALAHHLDCSGIDEGIRSALSGLAMPELARTARIQDDLSKLRPDSNHAPLSDAFNRSLAWRQRIEQSIQSKPHRVLAYQWTMYMALFNGGRWIRSQLTDAGPDFWARTPTNQEADVANTTCLSFWNFEGDDDGEDIKDEFKSRFVHVTSQLSDQHRQDIIDESVQIFDVCHEMVEWLDGQVAVENESDGAHPTPRTSSSSGLMPQYSSLLAILSSVWWTVVVALVRWRRPAYAASLQRKVRSE